MRLKKESSLERMTTTSAYSTSVKLPNLISVTHPSARLVPKRALNVEGRGTSGRSQSVSSRNCQITALLGNENNDRNRQKTVQNAPRVNIDEIMNLINEKLSTGYHGVEHLFKSNDIHKDGRLSKEAFKWVLNQLCGYISSDAWLKLCSKFNLTERDSISFDEFISNFLDNQKVQRELISSSAAFNKKSIQLINPTFSYSYSVNDKFQSAPKLSAAYCLALLKARASQSDFNPAHYLPEECLNNSKLIMPYHLESLLRKWNLELTDGEFDKLWERFDLNNSGGVKSHVFLRLINYKPYQLEELSRNLDYIRTKTCLNLMNPTAAGRNRNSKSCVFKQRKLHHNPETTTDSGQQNSSRMEEVGKSDTSFCQSSLSAESRIKSMVHVLKNSNKLAPGQDLIAFLNNKLNEGYVLMRTAFEYVDQDCFGYLLLDEFKCVLEEFNIRMSDKVFQILLKKYSLLKKTQLIDYLKFLKVFQDQRDIKNRLQKVKSSNRSDVEEAILEFFHGSFYNILDFINDSNGSQPECSIAHLKKLLEQKFSIAIESKQLGALYRFVTPNKNDEEIKDEDKINWVNLLEKFSSSADPWKIFRESIDLSKSVSSSSKPKSEDKKSETETSPTKKVVEFKDVEKEKLEAENNNFSDEDEEVKKVCAGCEEETAKDDNSDDAIKKYLLSIPRIKQSSQLRKQMRKELKTIKKVEKKIENVLRTQFHRMNKTYSIMDPSHSEKINKEKFGQLLSKLGLELSQEELELIWRDFDAELVRFSNIVRRFFKPDEFDRIRDVHYKRKIDDTIKEDLLSSSRREFRSSTIRSCLERSLSLDTINLRRKTSSRPKMSSSLIDRLKYFVNHNMKELKAEFEKEDKTLGATVSKDRTLDVFKQFNFELSKDDRESLLAEFDQNGCEFDYVKFLNHFKSMFNTTIEESNSSSSISIDTLNPVIKQIIVKLRDSPETARLKSAATENQKTDLNNLKNLFKKFDATKKGYLEPLEFRALLDSLKIEANSNDMYLISSQFDPDLKGLFRYEMFLKSFIDSII